MKPGNRHICEMVPNHSKCNALIDERNGNVHNYIRSAFLLICRKAFFINKSGKRRLGSTDVGRLTIKALFAFLVSLKRPEELASVAG